MARPKFSILKARELSQSSMAFVGNFSRLGTSRLDRKGHVIDESRKDYNITFADDLK